MIALNRIEVDGNRLELVELAEEVGDHIVDMPVSFRRCAEELLGRDNNLLIESTASVVVGYDLLIDRGSIAEVRVLRTAGRRLERVHTISTTSRRWIWCCVSLRRGDLTRSLDIDRIEIDGIELGLRLIRLVEPVEEVIEIGDCSIEIYKVCSEGIWSRDGILHMGVTVGEFTELLRGVGDSLVVIRRGLLLVKLCSIERNNVSTVTIEGVG